MVDAALTDAYLTRLGLEREAPSVDALRRLHRAQVERVPYETTWIHMDHRWSVDRETSMRRVALEHRGGYCFHLNGALSLLLGSLGYDTTLHIGGVHGPDGPDADKMDNHLVLIVHGLPDESNPGGDWYVDAGLGDALHDPLPLIAGAYGQGSFTYSLGAIDGTVGDWQLLHDPAGSFVGMAFRAAPTTIDSFVARNEFLSTSPDSSFQNTVTAQRRDADGIDILRGQVLRRLDAHGLVDNTIETRADWFDVLREQFDLPLDDVTADDRDRLWKRTAATHDAWRATVEAADVRDDTGTSG